LRTAQTILSISLLQHVKSLRKRFSQFETKFDANTLLLKTLHISTCKKIAERTKHTLIQAMFTQLLSDIA
jgi:hypothetical protein